MGLRFSLQGGGCGPGHGRQWFGDGDVFGEGDGADGLFEEVQPLMQPAARISLSNVAPFISDGFLTGGRSASTQHKSFLYVRCEKEGF